MQFFRKKLYDSLGWLPERIKVDWLARAQKASSHCLQLIRCLGCLLLLGCAKVGDPVPPVSEPPLPVSDLQLVQVGDRLQLIFSRFPEDVVAVHLFANCSDPNSPTNGQDPQATFERDDIKPYPEENSLVFVETQARPNTPCQLELRLLDRRGRISKPSNRVNSISLSPASPPANLRSEVHRKRILLRWNRPDKNIDGSSPSNVVGYLLNSKHRVSGEHFEDLEFTFGVSKTYWIQTISFSEDPLILSAVSDHLTVIPEDTFPPQVPGHLSAVYLMGNVQVLWDRSADSDLQGYRVYRGTNPRSLRRISGRVPINRYTDEDVRKDETYYYQVSALDTSGNESPQSAPVRVRTTD